MTRAEQRKEWETRVAEYRSSGQSVKAWCSAHNVKPHQLGYWLKRHQVQDDSPFIAATQWLPLEIREQAFRDKDSVLRVRVGEASIEVRPGFDPELLVEVVRILITRC